MAGNQIDASGAKIFQSNIELFIFCALYGVVVKRKAKPQQLGKEKPNKIFAEQFQTHDTELKLAFKFVTLLGNENEYDAVARLNKTFRNPDIDDNYTAFEEYALGGLEELHEKLFVSSNKTYEDYLTAINKIIAALVGTDTPPEDSEEVDTSDFF